MVFVSAVHHLVPVALNYQDNSRSNSTTIDQTPRHLVRVPEPDHPCSLCSALLAACSHALLALRSRCDACSPCSSRLPTPSSTSAQSSVRLWAGHTRGCYLWGPFRAAGRPSVCEIQISRGAACDRLLVYHFRTLADPTLLSAVHGRVNME